MNTHSSFDFDVIVIGSGHAGLEAAHAAAKMGSRTLMVTLHLDAIGRMSCNPSIGGVGKGHIVYEISALGGLMPQLCSKTYIQARMLNTKKGPAVQGLRLQIDKYAYSNLSKQILENLENLTLRMGMVEEILLDNNRAVCGIKLQDEAIYTAPNVIVAAGTFLKGTLHIGDKSHSGGRQGEEASNALSDCLRTIGLTIGRLKTGTPPRLFKKSLDFSKMAYQEAENLDYLFEFHPLHVVNSHACYITHTNAKTHEIIQKNRHRSAMFSGNITGIGPRYCPSIEDKIGRFPDKTSHHVFVEPEGATSEEIYPNGISTSLPYEIQKAYVRTIVGFENAVITRPGYAVEYDFVFPNQMLHTLETKTIKGLFLAGQINGTTGYEEAAAQGLIAGINAHLKQTNQKPFIVDRTESYIGVMIDDLVTLGVDEPYRMFTSRAEHRLTLRQDNAFLRFAQKGYHLGLLDEQTYTDFKHEKEIINDTLAQLRSGKNTQELLTLFGNMSLNKEKITAILNKNISPQTLQTIHAELLYEPYLKREQREIQRSQLYKQLILPPALQYKNMPGLSRELQEKLVRYKPSNIAQASLIPGITPAAISLLILKAKQITA